jgi:hypothetical protein
LKKTGKTLQDSSVDPKTQATKSKVEKWHHIKFGLLKKIISLTKNCFPAALFWRLLLRTYVLLW